MNMLQTLLARRAQDSLLRTDVGCVPAHPQQHPVLDFVGVSRGTTQILAVGCLCIR